MFLINGFLRGELTLFPPNYLAIQISYITFV
ncbi:hypothetical protein PGTDC60_1820 [Porphyromonas gingivalis TDC60]|nr:hypothetical protein PGTDC60_1820 [Porphyromonas gingivalis TDC60]